MGDYCTCTNYKCTLHPKNQELGCTPCIQKNMKLSEVPSCFFNLVKGAENRAGDGFEDFARLVIQGS